jgi:hypothetical protein
MSGGNGIYILESKDGFRVVHAQAIDNLWWWDDICAATNEINPKYLKNYFRDSKIYKTKQEALTEAVAMYDKIMESEFPVLEYGISFIKGWKDKDFPK